MKESMEDRIIERYLNGQMRPEEERDFRALLEIDPELRRRMDAEKIVQQALEHDRAEIEPEQSASYARFLAALATSVPAAEGTLLQSSGGSSASTAGSTGAGAATGGSGALSGGFASTLLAGGMAKGILGVVAAVTMAAGVYIATPESGVTEREEPAAVAPAAGAQGNTPMMIDSSSSAATGAPHHDAGVSPETTNREVNAAAASVEPAPAGNTEAPQQEASSHEGATRSTPAQESAKAEQPKQSDLDAMLKNMEKDAARQIDVIESDSVATAVKIGSQRGEKEKTK